ncbi:MAG: class II fructose-bisphosphate aldolase [Agriterribacter sp.]
MALVSMNTLMHQALDGKYAVGYFEAWNMESILAVVDAAQRTKSPVIIGFGGQFVGSKKREIKENIYHYGQLGKAIAETATVPVALLLNEAHEVDMLLQGMNSGFNAIMFEGHDVPKEEFIRINKQLVQAAHQRNVCVEAEIGRLPDADIANNSISDGEKTDPDEAVFFVKETGIDALAVSIGNVHLLETGKAKIDFDLIKTLRKKIKVPLVLHGGTGIAEDELREAVALGMCKVNVGTSLKRAYLNAIQQYLQSNNISKMDPHNVIGRGGDMDILSIARESVAKEVVRFIKIIGSENKA